MVGLATLKSGLDNPYHENRRLYFQSQKGNVDSGLKFSTIEIS